MVALLPPQRVALGTLLALPPLQWPSWTAAPAPTSSVRAVVLAFCVVWPAFVALTVDHRTAELPPALPWLGFPEPVPHQAASTDAAPGSGDTSAASEAPAAPVPAAAPIAVSPPVPRAVAPSPPHRPVPQPARAYEVPPPARAAGLPFRPTVARWRPLVEAELGRLRAVRTLDMALTPALLLTLIEVESGGDPYAVSGAEALGLMQLMPRTFAVYEGPTGDPFEPAANIRAGTLYLDELLRRHGDLRWALAGYNAGLTASLRARAGETRLVPTTDAFVTQVTTLLARASAEATSPVAATRAAAAVTPASVPTAAPTIR